MASAFLTEAEARSARACVPSTSTVSSSLDDLVDNTNTSTQQREAEREEEATTTLEARLQYIATRVTQGYILSEEEKEVLRLASELEE